MVASTCSQKWSVTVLCSFRLLLHLRADIIFEGSIYDVFTPSTHFSKKYALTDHVKIYTQISCYKLGS